MIIWEKIKCYDGAYEVSNEGNIRSLKHSRVRVLKFDLCKGYYRVTLSKNNTQKRYQVNRLVAFIFKKRIPGKWLVNHIDGNKLNNNCSNLEWSTSSENELHSYKKLGKINPHRKLTDAQVSFIRKNHLPGKGFYNTGTTKKLMLMFNVDRHTILNAASGKYYAT